MITATVLLQVTETLNKLKVEDVVNKHLSFFDLLIKGGVILIPIGILSLLSIYVMAEKYFYIHKYSKVSKEIRSRFKEQLLKGDQEQALAVLKSSEGSYSAIFSHAIKNSNISHEEVEKELESVSNIEVAKMSKNLNYLGLIAGIAPMLGFIGTISGIIKIFYNISITDNISIGIISGGLYEKMISSGSGLIVGVLAYTGYHMLNMILEKFIALVESDAFDVLNIIKDKQRRA